MKAIYGIGLLTLALAFCARAFPHGQSESAQREVQGRHAQVLATEPRREDLKVPTAEPRSRYRGPLLGPVPTGEPRKHISSLGSRKPLKLSLGPDQQAEGHAGTKARKTVTPSLQPKAAASKKGTSKQPLGQPATSLKPAPPQ